MGSRGEESERERLWMGGDKRRMEARGVKDSGWKKKISAPLPDWVLIFH